MRDGLQKEPSCNPGAHSHLPGFQHDVPPARLAFVLPLRGVGGEGNAMPLPVSDFEDLFDHCQSSVSTDVELFAHADKVLPRTLSQVEGHARATDSWCIPSSAGHSEGTCSLSR